MSSKFRGVVGPWLCAGSWGLVSAGILLSGCGGDPQPTPEPVDQELKCQQGWFRGMQFGTEQGDEALALGAGPEGELYVAGYEGGVLGQSNLGPVGDAQGYVMSLGAGGAMEWKAPLQTDGTDTVEALVVDPDGAGLWVAGRTTGSFEGFTTGGQFDGFLASVTKAGEAKVLYQWGDARPQHPVGLTRAVDGSFVVAGYDDTYVPSNYVESWDDPFALRIIPTGAGDWTTAWQQYRQSEQPDWYTGLASGQGAESYVSGNSPTGSGRGAFVQHFDEQGALAWSQQLSSAPFDTAAKIETLPGGDVLVAGSTFGAVGQMPLKGDQDVYLARLDGATGELRWAVRAGSNGSEFVTALAVDSRGRVFVGGDTDGAFDGATGERGGQDAFVLQFDLSGKLLGIWQHGSVGGRDDHVADVRVDACGQVYAAGYTEGIFVDGSDASGGRDAFVVPIRF